MNILFITNELNYSCGVTAHLLNLAMGLEKAENINIYLICGGGNGIEKFKDIDADITVNKAFLNNNRSYISYAKAEYFLVRFIKKNKIDIIHSHTHDTANLAHKVKKYCNVMTVHTTHCLLDLKDKFSQFRADKLIAINEHIYKFIINNKIHDKINIRFIRYGIPVPRNPAWKAKIKPKILAASGFEKERELNIFIRAVSLLPEHNRINTEFMITGEGEQIEKLKNLNNEYGLNIKFLGRVDDMPSLLRRTHVFVFPSSSESEGFPAVIAEAAAYNNLIITAGFCGIEKVLISDIDGLIFKTCDAYDLMIKLKLAIDSYNTFKPMAEHFYNKVKELHDLNTMIKKHAELYNSCLKNC